MNNSHCLQSRDLGNFFLADDKKIRRVEKNVYIKLSKKNYIPENHVHQLGEQNGK
jgi:hypothetical protein